MEETAVIENAKLTQYTQALRSKYILNNRVMLIQSPQFLFDAFNADIARSRGYYAYPPTGLQCIAKALSERNLEIRIVDLNYLLLKEIIRNKNFNYQDWLGLLDEYLERFSPSVIGVTSINVYSDVFSPGYPLTSILEYLSSKDKYIVLAGGPIATNEYKNYLERNLCHFVIGGEGENKVNFLFDYLFNGESKEPPLQQVYFKFSEGVEQAGVAPDRVALKGNLGDTYGLFPVDDYHNVGSLNPYSRMGGMDRPFGVFQLNRGCRANCRFCGVTSFMGTGVRSYPVRDVVSEIKFLVEEKGIRHFDVLDDDFLVNKEAVRELLLELVKLRKDYGITWSSNNGLIASSITEELMVLMRDSGCVGFRIGIESGSPEMLKKMRKPANLELLKKAGALLNRFPEIFSGGNYILGLLAEETFGQMLETFKLCGELNLDWASFAIFQFTSTSNAIAEGFRGDGRAMGDFVPSKNDSRRQIVADKKVLSGSDIFALPKDCVPSHEQLKQIWFSFNLVANYINNKNLKEGGRPEKFVSWVEAVHIAYPDNPYMPLFAGIGYILLGKKDLAIKQVKNANDKVKASKYWNNRFVQFDLHNLLSNFPQTPQEAMKALETTRSQYSQWYGENINYDSCG
jgi:tRNA A37 methylthiotransferase MiaB